MLLGPVMLDIEGKSLTAEDKELLQHPNVGGLILFSRNYQNREQIKELVRSVRKIKEKILIAVDQEGGRVQRFQEGFTQLKPLHYFGELYDKSPDNALAETEKAAYTMASEIRSVGIDISFAPVLDLDWGVSEIIGSRSFHANPEIVAILAKAYISGMKRAGMFTTGKHFPGHGAVKVDSHLGLPEDKREFKALLTLDLLPYVKLVNDLDAVMMAHVLYSAIDSEIASFSAFWIKEVLRSQIGFKGIIFSDDLSMAGAKEAGKIEVRAKKALEAGCDMILICNDRQAAVKALEGIER